MSYRVILKSLSGNGQVVLASQIKSEAFAIERKAQWRKALGGKNWTVDRRPGLDTLDDLALTVEKYND